MTTRVFVDCTHTANHRYKNTGIHRVVRQITLELLEIAVSDSNLEIIPVKFDGTFITRLNLNSLEVQDIQDRQSNKELVLPKKANRKIFIYKIKHKLKKMIADYLIIGNQAMQKPVFEGIKFSARDVYLIADANWDLPRSYYHFLQNMRKHEVKIVSICYDLIPIKFPEFCPKAFVKQFKDFYYKYSDCFDQVICISNKSAEDYIEAKRNGILPDKNKNQVVNSFRLGSDYSKDQQSNNYDTNSNNLQLMSLINQRYILVVGSLVPHKNIKTIVAAFDLLTNINGNTHLIFAGNRGWHNDADILVEKNKMYGKLIHILDSVSDSDLRVLYENCYCLVQASFYEGFGLPVVEALNYNKPVISSNGGSLPEVGGDFCLYFEPTEPVQLSQALAKLLESDTFYKHLVARITNEYTPFSWKDSANQLLSLLSIK
jgi:glycosyltransferase involved in cell wall biosynthesis